MNVSDLPGADRIRAQVGFNQRIDDWENLLHWEPDGCFVAECDSRIVGTATTTTFGSELGWIGMLLVDQTRRRQGIGNQLLSAALTALSGVWCIGLDATPEGREMYLGHGFFDRVTLQRWEGQIAPRQPPIPDLDLPVTPLRVSDLEEVIQLDQAANGARRERILTRLYAGSPDTCWIVRRGGRLVGFALSRPGSVRHVLGPVITAADPQVTSYFLNALLDRLAPKPLVTDVPSRSVVEPVLSARGLHRVRPLIRMSQRPLPEGQMDRVIAIASPEIG